MCVSNYDADSRSITFLPDMNILNGAYTYTEGSLISIPVTIDAHPVNVANLSKESVTTGIISAVDISRIYFNNSEFRFLSPLSRNDSGLYTVVLGNPAGILTDSFRINVLCK